MVSKTNEQALESAIEKAFTGICFRRHIQIHPDFQLKVAHNKDAQNSDFAFKKILKMSMDNKEKRNWSCTNFMRKKSSSIRVYSTS